MPNWAGSSWYYLRYYDAHNDQAFADPKKLKYWGEVDLYLGGMEHTTLHLLYSRFWHQFFYDQGLVPTPEPYHARRGQGIILAADGTKMSKSKGNVVNPTEIIDDGYGADALRLAIAFLAPYDQTTPWSPEAVAGTFRFLQRVWTLVQEYQLAQNSKLKILNSKDQNLLRAVQGAIHKVSADIQKMNFNTAVSALMELTNQLYKIKVQDNFTNPAWPEALENLLKLLAPYAPHITEELWEQLGHDGSIHIAPWPASNPEFLQTSTVTIVVQINGKVRGQLNLPTASSQEDVVAAAKADPKVADYLKDQKIVKTVFVPGKLVSFVVS
jgi:leucyl-tRNA synthetase